MAREKITLSKEAVEKIIQGFCADAKPKAYRSSVKSKEQTVAEQPEFDVDSINLNIFGDEDEAPTNKKNSVPSDNKVANATNVISATEATDTAKVIDVTTEESTVEPKPEQADDPPASTAKPTRISAKMRRATRAEFCAAYTGKVNTKGGKPIAIVPTIMERLYRLGNLSGDRNACPTYIINNLLSEFLDAVEPEARKWGSLD